MPVLSRTRVVLRPIAERLRHLLEATSSFTKNQRSGLQNALGLTLSVIGDQAGDNGALADAAGAYRAALEERTRDRVPLDWAQTQNNLGLALATLGKWESGTGHLTEAVAAYRAALEERTRDRVPLDWAMTQNNLGNALERLGERESGTTHLTEAIAAWEACLTVTASTWPQAWVQTVHSHIDQARAENARRASQ
jgi:tetratricopeptide (TPR) repeat protein